MFCSKIKATNKAQTFDEAKTPGDVNYLCSYLCTRMNYALWICYCGCILVGYEVTRILVIHLFCLKEKPSQYFARNLELSRSISCQKYVEGWMTPTCYFTEASICTWFTTSRTRLPIVAIPLNLTSNFLENACHQKVIVATFDDNFFKRYVLSGKCLNLLIWYSRRPSELQI